MRNSLQIDHSLIQTWASTLFTLFSLKVVNHSLPNSSQHHLILKYLVFSLIRQGIEFRVVFNIGCVCPEETGVNAVCPEKMVELSGLVELRDADCFNSPKSTVFLFVGLCFTLRNFKVWRSGKDEIKIWSQNVPIVHSSVKMIFCFNVISDT